MNTAQLVGVGLSVLTVGVVIAIAAQKRPKRTLTEAEKAAADWVMANDPKTYAGHTHDEYYKAPWGPVWMTFKGTPVGSLSGWWAWVALWRLHPEWQGQTALPPDGQRLVAALRDYVYFALPSAPPANPEPDPPALTDLAGGIKAAITGAGDNLLVVLHGRDANEELTQPFVPAGLNARVAFLRAPLPAGGKGWRWYEAMSSDAGDVLLPQIHAAADKVALAIDELALTFSPAKIYVLGFSQGASVAYDLVARGLVDGAVIVSGFWPSILKDGYTNQAKLWAIHGGADGQVAPARGEAAYAAFVGHVNTLGWTLIPGATHDPNTMTAAIRQQVQEMVG